MKYLILFPLFFPIVSFAHKKEAKKLTLNASLMAKKSFCYNKKEFQNTNNVYQFKSKIQPVFEFNLNYRINQKTQIQIGISAASSKYWISYARKSESSYFNQKIGTGVTSFKVPVRIAYQLFPRFKVGLGGAFNYHSFSSLSSSANYSGYDSVGIFYHYPNPEFKDFITFSNQALFSYQLSPKLAVTALFDIDWGKYPLVDFYHEAENLSTHQITTTKFYGAPKMFYFGLGLEWKIW